MKRFGVLFVVFAVVLGIGVLVFTRYDAAKPSSSIVDAIANGTIKYCYSEEYVLRVGVDPIKKTQLLLLTPEDNLRFRESVEELFAPSPDQMPDLGVYFRRGAYPAHNYVIGIKKVNGIYCEVLSANSATLEPYVSFNQTYK